MRMRMNSTKKRNLHTTSLSIPLYFRPLRKSLEVGRRGLSKVGKKNDMIRQLIDDDERQLLEDKGKQTVLAAFM